MPPVRVEAARNIKNAASGRARIALGLRCVSLEGDIALMHRLHHRGHSMTAAMPPISEGPKGPNMSAISLTPAKIRNIEEHVKASKLNHEQVPEDSHHLLFK